MRPEGRNRQPRVFILLWMVATALGIAAGHLLGDLVWFGVSSRWLFPFVPFGGALLGVVTGPLQWLALRSRVPRSHSWMLATAAGWAGSWAIGSTAALVLAAPGGNTLFLVSMACGTPVIGLAQRAVLRNWSTRADSWLVPSAVGWIALISVEVLGPQSLSSISGVASRLVETVTGYSPSSTVGASVLGGLLLGAISGIAMTRMLESPGRTLPLSVR